MEHNPLDFVENEFHYIHYKNDLFYDASFKTVIDKLYNDYNHDDIEMDRKKLRRDAINLAIHIFSNYGSIRGFIYYQLRHAFLTKYARRFLIDTYQFIVTGKRDISIESWQYLLHESNNNNERIKTDYPSGLLPDEEKRINYIDGFENPRPYELAQWLKHDYGMQDLIWSLKILFGTNTRQEVIY